MECREIDFVGLREVVHGLHSGIEENAVKIWVAAGDVLDKGARILAVTDVVCKATSFIAMLANKSVDSILSTANSDDFGAMADELLGHSQADAGGGTNHQNTLVGERHGVVSKRIWIQSGTD